MALHIRIPFIADIIQVRSADEILALGDNEHLDRGYKSAGPILNRWIAGRVRRALSLGNRPLPSAALRDDEERQSQQRVLASRLDPASKPAPWDDEAVDAAVACVRGLSSRPPGEIAQELIGRLFVKDYRATAKTWRAARALDRGLTSNNVLKRLYWLVTFRMSRAHRVLHIAAEKDLAGVHATGIAVHNLVESLQRMAALFQVGRHISDEEVIAKVLVAPERIVRQSHTAGATIAGDVRDGTLVILGVGEAGARTLDQSISFMSDSWSFCPAHKFVPALLLEIWHRAKAADGGAS